MGFCALRPRVRAATFCATSERCASSPSFCLSALQGKCKHILVSDFTEIMSEEMVDCFN